MNLRKKRKNILEKYFYIFDNYPRHYFVMIFFGIFVLVILSTLFKYTIMDHTFYSEVADAQQIGEVEVPVTRGSILSANGDGTIMATSVRLNDLAVDPTSPGSKKKLIEFLAKIVYRESCEEKELKECKNNILKFIKFSELEGFTHDREYIDNLILKRLEVKIAQKKVTSVLLAQEIDTPSAEEIASLHLKGVYVNESNVYINPEEVENQKQLSSTLAPLLKFPEKTVFYLIRKREIKYIPILPRLSIDSSSMVRSEIKTQVEMSKKGFLREEDSIYKFIVLSPNPHRLYPDNSIGSQVLGFVDNRGEGHYGIEGYFHDILEGEAGEIVSRKDIRGRTIDPIDAKTQSTIHREGAVLQTTIDRNMQNNIEEILEKGVKKYNANKGSIIVMEPKTGKILTMANYPSFDPNRPGDVYELERVYYKDYRNPANELIGKGVFVEDTVEGKEFYFEGETIYLRPATRKELWNYALKKYKYKNDFGTQVYRNTSISDVYEPGSIMKAMTMAVGIDSGEITAEQKYQNDGPVRIDSFKISDIARQCRGYHSFAHALNYSCNVGMVRIIQKVGKALFYDYLQDFGFGKPTGVALAGEVVLPMRHYEKWSRAQLFTSSYGLGINVNQLQMALAYSSLVNGGLLYKPQIIEKILFQDSEEVEFGPEVVRRVVSEKTSNIMRDVLVDSVDNGVAETGKVRGYSVGGKTGTSQIAYRGGYEDGNLAGSTNASFAGFGPAQDPKFVVIVTLNRPRTNNYGGQTSAFIFAEAMEYLLQYYNIPKLES